MPAVVFYISGHGFGHASRRDRGHQRARRAPARPCDIVVRTSAPRWLFDRTVASPLTLIDGAVRHRRRADRQPAARRSATTIARRRGVLPQRCRPRRGAKRRTCARTTSRLVIADAPPLALRRGARAPAIPSVVVSNFTWDWIYEAYSRTLARRTGPASPRSRRPTRSRRRHGGCRCTAASRRSPHRSTCRSSRGTRRHARDERPAAARPAGRRAAGARARSAATASRASIRRDLDCLDRWHVVLTGRDAAGPLPAGVTVPRRERGSTTRAALRRSRRAPSTSSSPSRATASSPSASRTTPRCSTPRAAASPSTTCMVAEMPRFLRCEYIDLDSLLAGRWREALDR